MRAEDWAVVAFVVLVGVVLALAGIGLWHVYQQRKAWDAFVRARDSRMAPTSNADDFGGFPG